MSYENIQENRELKSIVCTIDGISNHLKLKQE